MTGLLLSVLLGMLGLVVDSGRLMAEYRHAQNVADAAATAAAMDILRGKSTSTASATARDFAREYHGFTNDPTPTVNIPPSSGPYAGQSNFAEIIIRHHVRTSFVQIFGTDGTQTIEARAVAGFEPVTSGEGVIALDPTMIPGIKVSGGATLKVNGVVLDNSEGGGVDENGNSVNTGTGYAADASNNGTVMARDIRVVGGVNNPANFRNVDPNNTASPLHARSLPAPDPLEYLPTPTTANGVDPTFRGAVSVSGNNVVTLNPGIYSSIEITGGTVTFSPGIYVITGGKTTSFKITGGAVTGNGVMFYNTGDNYNAYTGWPDSADGNYRPPAADGAKFGGVTINSSAQLSPLSDTGTPFDGMLFYQRRRNTQALSIEGNAADGSLTGTLYAKWAQLKLAGQGTYGAQMIVGSFDVTGNGIITVKYAGKNTGKGYEVFLVE